MELKSHRSFYRRLQWPLSEDPHRFFGMLETDAVDWEARRWTPPRSVVGRRASSSGRGCCARLPARSRPPEVARPRRPHPTISQPSRAFHQRLFHSHQRRFPNALVPHTRTHTEGKRWPLLIATEVPMRRPLSRSRHRRRRPTASRRLLLRLPSGPRASSRTPRLARFRPSARARARS